MDIVAVLTTVTKEQKAKMEEKDAEVAMLQAVTKDQAAKLVEKDAELAALRDSFAQQQAAINQQEERTLQMELVLAEVLRNQSPKVEVSSAN
jgi:phage-related tail protein